MSSNRLLQLLNEKSFECRISGDHRMHLLNIDDTRILPCNNLCCFKCIRKVCDKKLKAKIYCKLCNNIHFIENFNQLSKDNEIANIFNMSVLNYLKKYRETINYINGPEGNKNLAMKTFEFIEEDLELRILSIKNELENKQENLRQSINNLQKKYKRNKKKFIEKIEFLKSIEVKTSTASDTLTVQKCQKYLKKLNKFSKKLQTSKFITDSTLTIKLQQVGKLRSKWLLNLNIDINATINNEPKIIDLRKLVYSPKLMTTLNSSELAILDHEANIHILNPKFEVVKCLKNNHTSHNIDYICSNQSDRIYLCDSTSSKIIIKDFDTNEIIKIFGNFGISKYEFINTSGLCFYENSLYVLDNGNDRIQKFNSNGIYEKIFSIKKSNTESDFSMKKRHMAISNGFIVIVETLYRVSIYDIHGKFLRFLHSTDCGMYCACVTNAHLFIHGYYGSLKIFDLNEINQKDKKSIEHKFERYSKYINYISNNIVYFDDSLIVFCPNFNFFAVL